MNQNQSHTPSGCPNVPPPSGAGRPKPILPEADPVEFITEMVVRADSFGDKAMRRRMLQDILFQLSVQGSAVGAAAYYQPETFGGLETDEPDRNKDGTLKSTIRNYLLILSNTAQFASLRFNKLTGSFEYEGRPWTDDALSGALHYAESYYGIKSREDFLHALNLRKESCAYHPIVDRIAAVQWDGTDCIPFFLRDILGAEDTPYTREVSRLIFHCGMARLMNPGCKVDYMPILTGKQGCGKSTAVRLLALEDSWYGELPDIRDDKKAGELLRGKWMIEMGELSAFRATDEEIKQFITRQSDRYRQAYERYAMDFPRTCMFIGTTNNPRPLRDPTGNRRFLPVEIHADGRMLNEGKAGVLAFIEQCWAQAYALWQKGEIRPYPSAKLLEQIRKKQADTREDDPRVGDIRRYLSDPNHFVRQVCIKQLWREALGEAGNPKRRDSLFIAEVMDNMDGWKRTDHKISSGIYRGQSYWQRVEDF